MTKLFTAVFAIVVLTAIYCYIFTDAILNRYCFFAAVGTYILGSIAWTASDNAENSRREKEQAEARQVARANDAEAKRQLELQHERERLEMHAQIRIKELIATVEIQHRLDSAKMAQLTKIKAEFADRQKSDMAALLAQLESMRAGA